MKIIRGRYLYFLAYLTAVLMLAAVSAEAADVKELFAIDLADYAGKEGRMLEVSYPPGARDMIHRHDAHAFVYVLEGQIVMQLKGQPPVTLKAGQTFYEGPTDVHVVGRNASNTEPARFVVVLLKAKGAAILTPVNE
jgi:quercetin dioxygenase-like cupin family protein